MNKKLKKEECEYWVNNCCKNDICWTVRQTNIIANNMNIDRDKYTKYEFWALMNISHHYFLKHARHYNKEYDPEFYADIVLTYFIDKSPAYYFYKLVV